jgi:hypothetical protein
MRRDFIFRLYTSASLLLCVEILGFRQTPKGRGERLNIKLFKHSINLMALGAGEGLVLK